ncbi:GNAT family N-acetyltransferase [Chromobacterium violaceum]|uniref:GNAT family N-acetyltransferase n=1 Tax=Chromobacterium violaceum TaxID=536 RepID=UPI00068E952E|nr:GNAT family N-acetyltransferase [Chromobacterium violaceum]
MKLVNPSISLLPKYMSALRRGWTPESDDDMKSAQHILTYIEENRAVFLDSLNNPDGKGSPIILDNGIAVPRLSYARYWMIDNDYVGEINLRWQKGTSDLPAYCLGHIGYAVVPWKRGNGYACLALQQLKKMASEYQLDWLDISMDVSNIASRRTAEKAGAEFVKQFCAGPEYDNVEAVLYRLVL